jgi:hypothetical protein
MIYYDALRSKWKELGPPAVSDEQIAEAVRLFKTPALVAPEVPHWVIKPVLYRSLGACLSGIEAMASRTPDATPAR